MQWPYINHSDDELLYLVYYPLLTLEKDPTRRRLLVQSIARTWEEIEGEQSLRPEHNPFYNFIYGSTTGRRCDVEETRATLQDWPWDLVAWSTKNSHRQDVSMRTATGISRNRKQLDRVLSPAERTQGRWNANPWSAVGETTAAAKTTASHGWLPTGWGFITDSCRRTNERQKLRDQKGTETAGRCTSAAWVWLSLMLAAN